MTQRHPDHRFHLTLDLLGGALLALAIWWVIALALMGADLAAYRVPGLLTLGAFAMPGVPVVSRRLAALVEGLPGVAPSRPATE